jgi:hypothetical protein
MKHINAIFILSLSLVAANCFASSPLITGDSVGDLVIGRAPPNIRGDRLVFRRWESDENGQRYELIRVKVAGVGVDAEVFDGCIWRISINKSGLFTLDGLGVGASARTLLRKNPSIDPVIGPGPTLVLIPKKPCGISYITDAPLPDNVPENPTRASVSQLLRTAHVTKILVVGCKK